MRGPVTRPGIHSPHPALRPDGFHPLLGNAAARDRTLVNTLLNRWSEMGFTQVSPIQVDDAATLLANHGAEMQNRAFRFMDPQNGAKFGLSWAKMR